MSEDKKAPGRPKKAPEPEHEPTVEAKPEPAPEPKVVPNLTRDRIAVKVGKERAAAMVK